MRVSRWVLLGLLEVDRHCAFWAFYRAVARQRVTVRSAHRWWNRLLSSEALREEMTSVASGRLLARAYRSAASAEAGPPVLPGDEVPFGGLYLRIILGRTSLGRLKRYLTAA